MPFALGFETKGFSGLAALGTVAISLPLLGALTVSRVPEPDDATVSALTLKAALKEIAANRPFLRLLSAFFLNGLANGIPATLFLYFVSARLELPDMRGPFLFLYFLCGIAGIPLASLVAKKLGKHRAWSLAMIAACAVFAAAPLLPAGAMVGFALVCVLTGVLLGFDLVLPAAIQADVIDADTAASGDQRSGFYFAAWGLATKLSLAAGVGIVFPLLSLAGFSTEPAAANSDDALFALAMLYAWLPIALKLAAIALMWNFPLGETEQADLRSKIGARAGKP